MDVMHENTDSDRAAMEIFKVMGTECRQNGQRNKLKVHAVEDARIFCFGIYVGKMVLPEEGRKLYEQIVRDFTATLRQPKDPAVFCIGICVAARVLEAQGRELYERIVRTFKAKLQQPKLRCTIRTPAKSDANGLKQEITELLHHLVVRQDWNPENKKVTEEGHIDVSNESEIEIQVDLRECLFLPYGYNIETKNPIMFTLAPGQGLDIVVDVEPERVEHESGESSFALFECRSRHERIGRNCGEKWCISYSATNEYEAIQRAAFALKEILDEHE